MPKDKSAPGTYALILKLNQPAKLRVGRLGIMTFDSPYFMYLGSAFGPGGLRARLNHHLKPVARAHWHIDYLRDAAEVANVWFTHDPSHLECAWAKAAASLRGASMVTGFGSSDCNCSSHLLALATVPRIPTFRIRLNLVHPGSAKIRPLAIRCGEG